VLAKGAKAPAARGVVVSANVNVVLLVSWFFIKRENILVSAHVIVILLSCWFSPMRC
jgi:hypothetical protein